MRGEGEGKREGKEWKRTAPRARACGCERERVYVSVSVCMRGLWEQSRVRVDAQCCTDGTHARSSLPHTARLPAVPCGPPILPRLHWVQHAAPVPTGWGSPAVAPAYKLWKQLQRVAQQACMHPLKFAPCCKHWSVHP